MIHFKNKYVLYSVLSTFLLAFQLPARYEYPFQNPKLPIGERVDNLVSLLTIEEKVAQMINNAPAIERLGIPAYNWWNETLHGVARSPYHVTSYPQAIAMAATWDTASLHRMADYSATEGRAIFNDSKKKGGGTGIYLGLTYWTPNINIFRDPRWGRGQETYGEDPFLTGTLGKAFVRGLEGNDPRYLKASACAKHFAVHSGPEWNRHTYNAKVSDYDLWDTYLPAFRDLVVDAKVSGVMCAYNALDGQPCCGSDKLMNTILRNDWKFTGYVTSDCGGIGNFHRTHKTHPSPEAAAADAVLHGTDCECAGNPSYKALLKAVNEGLITEAQMDVSLKRLFTIRFRLGMFDPEEMVPFSKTGVSVLESEPHKAHALKMARQSMVLLKNENGLLPLRKTARIAVVGPNADDKGVMLANYYGYPTHITTLLEGIRKKVQTRVIYEKGINLTDNEVFKTAYPEQSLMHEGEPGFLAEYFQNATLEGSPVLVRTEKKIDYQWGDGEQVAGKLIARKMSVRWSTTYTPATSGEVTFELKGDDGCRLIIDGERKIVPEAKNPYYTMQVEKGKAYKLVIEYWQHSDNAEIKFDIGVKEKATAQEIASRVKDADVIIFAGGISARLEGEEMPVQIDGFKGGDRTNIALPSIQTELMKALKATGKPVVFVSMSGSAIGFEWEAGNVPAILQAWYGGQAGGDAIADVLFGDYNPAGRLPVTFYKNVNDLPDFEEYSMRNRTYRYFKGDPLYAFGYGLSYTSFRYSNLVVPATANANAGLTVKVNVSNTGKRDGEEVVQLYITHTNAETGGTEIPLLALKGFQRIHLKAGETRTILFKLQAKDLSIVDSNGKLIPGKGTVSVSAGGGQPSEISVKAGKVVRKNILLKG